MLSRTHSPASAPLHAQHGATAAARLTGPTTSTFMLTLFDHKNLLKIIDKAEAMPFGVYRLGHCVFPCLKVSGLHLLMHKGQACLCSPQRKADSERDLAAPQCSQSNLLDRDSARQCNFRDSFDLHLLKQTVKLPVSERK